MTKFPGASYLFVHNTIKITKFFQIELQLNSIKLRIHLIFSNVIFMVFLEEFLGFVTLRFKISTS